MTDSLHQAQAGGGLRQLSDEEAAGYDVDEQAEKWHAGLVDDHRMLVLDLDGDDPDDRAAARFYAARKASRRPQLARDLIALTQTPGEQVVSAEDVHLPGERPDA